MRKLNSLFSKLCLIALLSLPTVFTSCGDDDITIVGAPKIENLGMTNDTIVVKGESLNIAPVLYSKDLVTYTWTVNGTEVSSESSYTFNATAAGTYKVVFTAINGAGTDQAEILINVRSYDGGFYIVNEGQFGQETGSVCYYKGNQWSKRIFRENNPGKTIGATSTNGIIADNSMYFVSKVSPYLVKVDLNNFKQQGTIEGSSIGQANNFCAINKEVGVLTTSTGAYSVSLNPLGLGSLLPQTKNNSGDIIKAGDYIFILSSKDILVYHASKMTFVKNLKVQVTTGFVQTKDGSLWAADGNTLVKINVSTLETESITLSDNTAVNYNSMAYTPSCLCASTTENAFYFVKNDGWNNKEAYKYDVASNAITKVVSAPEGYSFYGAGLAVNPHTGNVYATFTEDGFGTHYMNNKIIVTDAKKGTSETIDYSGDYWFPSIIVFE